MRVIVLALLLSLVGCHRQGAAQREMDHIVPLRGVAAIRLPSAPKGTFWYRDETLDSLLDGAYLYSETGLDIAVFMGQQAWLYKCDNAHRVFKTRDEAVAAVVACGETFTTRTAQRF